MPSNPFPALVTRVNRTISLAYEANLLGSKEQAYLKIGEYNNPTLYMIPKLHKSLVDPPGRSIVSVINGPLERVGRYVDDFIKTMVAQLPSYVRDTRDVLVKLQYLRVPLGPYSSGLT